VCAALLLAVLAAPSGCAREPEPVQVSSRPDIVLVTIDSLRADHLGAYGYSRPTSPAIDAMAAEGVVVRDHIAQAPYTKASMASLFSGLFPTAHKAFTTSRHASEIMSAEASSTLPYTDVLEPQVTTLAERLASAGYHTVGLMTNPVLLGAFGFDQGFARYEFLSRPGTEFAPARDVVRAALAALDVRPKEQPMFLWVHLMEPHSPYSPPDDLLRLFPVLAPSRPIDPAAIPAWVRIGESTDVNRYLAHYDADIRSADDALGEFFAGLKTRGVWDAGVVVVTSDHGEEFSDHGGMEHNHTLYDEMLRVPLVVKGPGLTPGVVEAQTQAVDLLPTLAFLAGRPVEPDEVQGLNIWPLLQRRGRAEPYAYAEIVGRRFALRTREWKLISSLQGGRQLFDLRRDPQERENLARETPAVVAQLENTLARIVAASVQAGEHIQGRYAPIPAAVLDRLRSLGYVR
jgi:choline-sulfatase